MIDILSTLMEKEMREITKGQEKLTEQQIQSNESMDALQILFTLTATLEGPGIIASYLLQDMVGIGIIILCVGLVPTIFTYYILQNKSVEI